jgi:hypothetical protein
MMQFQAPEVVQANILISNARKDVLAAAMTDACRTFTMSARAEWEPYVETAAQKQARIRSERLAWVIDGL